MLSNSNDSEEWVIEKTCYICAVDLMRMYNNDKSQQNDLHASTQKFPEMVLWNRTTVEICGDCYKSVSEGLIVYKKANPHFELPKPRNLA